MVYFPEPVFDKIKDYLWGLPNKAHPCAQLIFNEHISQFCYIASKLWHYAGFNGRMEKRFKNKGWFPFSSFIDKGSIGRSYPERLCVSPTEEEMKPLVDKMRRTLDHPSPVVLNLIENLAESDDAYMIENKFGLFQRHDIPSHKSWLHKRFHHKYTERKRLWEYLTENNIKFKRGGKGSSKRALIRLALSF